MFFFPLVRFNPINRQSSLQRPISYFIYLLPRGFASSAGSDDDEDDEGLDPAVKVVKEKERRQANNARER